MYFDVFKKSWYVLKKNIVLFVPDLIFAVYILIFGTLFLKITGILNFLAANIQVNNPEVLLSFLTDNLLTIVTYLTFFILLTFFVGASVVSFKYSMMKIIVLNKKISLNNVLKNYKKQIWQVILLRFLIFLIIFISFSLLWFIIRIILKGQSSVVLILFWILFGLIIFGLIKLLLFFRYPIMFFENINALDVIRRSILYFRRNMKHVFVVFLIIFGVGVLFNFIFMPLNLVIELGRNFLSKFVGDFLNVVLIIFSSFIKSLISLIFVVWVDMFLFFSYKLKS